MRTKAQLLPSFDVNCFWASCRSNKKALCEHVSCWFAVKISHKLKLWRDNYPFTFYRANAAAAALSQTVESAALRGGKMQVRSGIVYAMIKQLFAVALHRAHRTMCSTFRTLPRRTKFAKRIWRNAKKYVFVVFLCSSAKRSAVSSRRAKTKHERRRADIR